MTLFVPRLHFSGLVSDRTEPACTMPGPWNWSTQMETQPSLMLLVTPVLVLPWLIKMSASWKALTSTNNSWNGTQWSTYIRQGPTVRFSHAAPNTLGYQSHRYAFYLFLIKIHALFPWTFVGPLSGSRIPWSGSSLAHVPSFHRVSLKSVAKSGEGDIIQGILLVHRGHVLKRTFWKGTQHYF